MEIFKHVPNFEDYMVSNKGNVKSFKRKNTILLKQGTDKDGYKRVVFMKDGIRKTFNVHQLVAMTFLDYGTSNSNLVVNHINFIRDDNNLENLELVTYRENASKKICSNEFIGVTKTESGRWTSNIRVNKDSIYLGTFDTAEEASEYYDKALLAIDNDLEINKKRQQTMSNLRGVSLIRSNGKWASGIWVNGKKIYLGSFDSKYEAHEYYNNAKMAIANNEKIVVKKATYSSKYEHICFSSKVGKWMAVVKIDGHKKHVGYFTTEQEAYNAQQDFLNKIIINTYGNI